MLSQDDERVTFLLRHGFSSSEIKNMTQKEINEAVSALLDSESNATQSNLPKKENTKSSNNPTKNPKKSKVFDGKLENAGLDDEQALRAALQQSIDYKSEPLDSTVDDDGSSNYKPPQVSMAKGIVDFVSNAFQTIRSTVQNAGSSVSNQFNYNDFEFSSDDDIIPITNDNKHYNVPPPPKNDITIPSKQHNNSYTPSKQNGNSIPSSDQNKKSTIPSYQYDDYSYSSNQNKKSTIPSYQYDDYSYSSNQNNKSTIPSYQYDDYSYSSNQNNKSTIPSSQYNDYTHPSNQSNYQKDTINDDYDDSKFLIQQQNDKIKRLEEEMNLKEQQEKEKKLIEEEENNIKEACQVSLADEIIDLLEKLPPEPSEPKTSAEKKNVVTMKIMMDDGKSIIRRFNGSDKGIYVYAWVAGHTLDSDEKLYMNNFELKMPMGTDQILDKNLTLAEQKLRGKVCFNVSEI